jgi:hypothetical protein
MPAASHPHASTVKTVSYLLRRDPDALTPMPLPSDASDPDAFPDAFRCL